MEAEYFPPKEDVILQNESPTDLYMLVSGAVDLIRFVDGHDQETHLKGHEGLDSENPSLWTLDWLSTKCMIWTTLEKVSLMHPQIAHMEKRDCMA
ncbi:hypothetical protein VNO78_07409 [Psophocarpus tetragonolobus]|uniref:Cyclic nucleotide-binding domain-containing protein n=1 Tax=Psophocarpus tetragonolobus TaxID=3891 RepID=A0AAN9SW48_PSOTE